MLCFAGKGYRKLASVVFRAPGKFGFERGIGAARLPLIAKEGGSSGTEDLLDLQTVKQLNEALQNPELLGTITPALAAGLGIIPLEARDDYICVGHVPGVCSDCFRFLERYFAKEVIGIPVEERLVHTVIAQAYLKGQAINHDTFPVPDYLLRQEYESKLLHEKEDDIGPVGCGLPEDLVLFLETSYHSLLVNLDSRETEEPQIDSDEIPFKIINGAPVVSGERVQDRTVLIERRNYCYAGCQDRQGIAREEVQSLPHLIHPSELQVTQIHADGSLTVFIYDQLKHVPVGSTARYEVPYYFISFGQRYQRTLVLTIHALHQFSRADIQYTEDVLPWGLEDVERWFNS